MLRQKRLAPVFPVSVQGSSTQGNIREIILCSPDEWCSTSAVLKLFFMRSNLVQP